MQRDEPALLSYVLRAVQRTQEQKEVELSKLAEHAETEVKRIPDIMLQ